MASEVEIANVALTLLGEERIASLDDDVKAAREIKALFNISRDALLGGYNWHFAMDRTSLSPLADAPIFGYNHQFQLPVDCLRIVLLAEVYVGVDLSDARTGPTEEFALEGRKILTDLAVPLPMRYVKRITDTAQFDSCFTKAFAAQLAADAAEPITQSRSKREDAERKLNREINLAIRANAIQLPPKKMADDEWLLSRL